MKKQKYIFNKIEEAGWSIYHEDGNVYDFGKHSPAGQDFHISVDTGNDVDLFKHNVYERYIDFDVSQETYLWLDESGHGKNGAPYDMKDLYEDMEACQEMILELYNIVNEVA